MSAKSGWAAMKRPLKANHGTDEKGTGQSTEDD
jgi:hypothetical protein